MAEAQSPADATPPDPLAAAPKSASLWRRLIGKWVLNTRTLGTIAVCSLALNAVGYGVMRARMQRTPPPPSPEIALGSYQFHSDGAGESGIVSARFNLHVSLLKEADKTGRAQLDDARFRVQQAIEELLRRAHGADFEDPDLADLKRQLQEQVNATLGVRAVSGVIITDLALRRGQPHGAEESAAAHQQQAVDESTNLKPDDDESRQPKPAG